MQTFSGGRVFNGFLFGKNELRFSTAGKSGILKFQVTGTNGAGILTVSDDKQAIFTARGRGNFSTSFRPTSYLKIHTTSSGWLFFMPAVYDIGKIEIEHG